MADLLQALEYLDSHVNFETAPARRATPTLDRMVALCSLLGDPQTAAAVVHLTGTNGKGSTARMISALLGAQGLSVGTYTSPHLERINERMAWNGEPIEDEALARLLLELRHYEDHLGVRLTHFELLTAAALRWFADNAVDVAVLEVGMGGRWDATNVADAAVAVITNISLDHAEVIGPTRRDIAREKAGIIKPGSLVVCGESDPELLPVFLDRPSAGVWLRGREFDCVRNRVGAGGRVVELRTPGGTASDVFLPLFGAHQGDNAAAALAAAEAFFGRPLDETVIDEAFDGVTVPGRFEVVTRDPLVVLDGAHNPAGAAALARTLAEDMGGRTPDVLVVGFTAGRDPAEILQLIGADRAGLVLACRASHPRSLDPAEIVAAAAALGVRAEAVPDVRQAVARARAEGQFVLVTGSLYLVGDARAALHGR